MIFTTLPMNRTILAPSSMHTSIRQEIIKEKQGMLGLKIMTLSQFLDSFTYDEKPNMYHILFEVYHKVPSILQQLEIYKNVIHSPLFLKECYRFLNDIHYWGITKQELPCDTAAEKELHQILSLFDGIILPNDLIRDTIQRIQDMDFSNIYIVDCYHDLEDEYAVSLLLKNGAHTFTLPQTLIKKEFYHAVNKRQEIEACAQHIIEHNIDADDIHITLCDTTGKPLLQQVFERYQIPCTFLSEQRTSLLAKQFTAAFQFVLHPDNEHLFACLDTGLFASCGLHALRTYMQIFEADFFSSFTHVQKIHETGNILDAYTLEKLQKLEKKASETQKEILPFVTSLTDEHDISNIMGNVIEFVKAGAHITSNDIATYKRINDVLEQIYPYMQTKDDIEFLLAFFDDIHIDLHSKEIKGALIHDLTQPVLPRKHHYILQATQNNYPAFKPKKGIFDERYYAKIINYPTMEQRYAFYNEQLQKQLLSSSHVYISYPIGTYEGKSLESALEIEQFMNMRSLAYPIHTNYIEILRNDTIDEKSAKALFIKDHKLHGSISSLERYVKCPFSYFLRYGLSLKEPMKLGFPDSYAGTLSHFILETLTNTYGKAYANTTRETLEAIVDKELQYLTQVFPANADALDHVKTRLLTSMTQTLATLRDFEQHSSLSPSKSEYPFDYDIMIDEETSLALHGYIDRIDEAGDLSCILDYKSSTKTLSVNNVFAALQLQLITYAMVIHKQLGKEVVGAYYVSLKNENINCSAGKMSRRKPVTHIINGREEFESERKKAQRMNGWSMYKDLQRIDDDASHINGLRMNKDGEIKAGKLYDLNVLEDYMKKMYIMISKRILSGDIACKPLEDACTYCVYHEICRFKGYYEDKQMLIECEDEIYLKGDEEDA